MLYSTYLVIPIYLWLLKKLLLCLKELLIGDKLREITLARGFSVPEQCKYIHAVSGYETRQPWKVNSSAALWISGAPLYSALQQKAFHLSLVLMHLFGLLGLSACTGRGRNSNKANYKGWRKTEGQHNRRAVRHPLLQLHTAEKSDPEQQQASVRSNPSCWG